MEHWIPRPAVFSAEKDGFFSVPQGLCADLGDFAPWFVEAFQERSGLKIKEGNPWLILEKDASLPQEHYRLTVASDRVTVAASGERGIIWALTGLYLLMKDGKLPLCAVEDGPRFGHRGLSFDCARHFFSHEEVKKVIEGLSLAKINVLHWHLADDQGWRIESKVFPELHSTGTEYYTQDQIRDVVAFARSRGVEMIPEIDMPGHTSAILAVYPELGCFGKKVDLPRSGGIFSVILCPGKEETFLFTEKLLEELVALFPGERFHIGGDEAPKSEWKKCPHCRARMEALGITEPEDLQGYFAGRIVEILKKHGKTAICWNETLHSSNYPEDIQIQYWMLQHRASTQAFAAKGGKYIYSDMFELYLDYPHAMTPLKKIFHTVPQFGGKPIGNPKNLLGLEACLWSEQVTTNERLEQLLFPRMLAVAELAWSGPGDYSEFKDWLAAWMALPINSAIAFTAPDWWDPRGKGRQAEALRFFRGMFGSMPEELRQETAEAVAPSREYILNYIRKFLKLWDIPVFLKALRGK